MCCTSHIYLFININTYKYTFIKTGEPAVKHLSSYHCIDPDSFQGTSGILF